MMKESDIVAIESDLERRIRDLMEVVYTGDFTVEEIFHKYAGDDEAQTKRLLKLEEELDMFNQMGKYDEHLVNQVKTFRALMEIEKLRKQLKSLREDGDPAPDSITLG